MASLILYLIAVEEPQIPLEKFTQEALPLVFGTFPKHSQISLQKSPFLTDFFEKKEVFEKWMELNKLPPDTKSQVR
jgi:hypothetical protein